MKTLNKALLVLVTSAVAVGANAAVSYGSTDAGQPYVGAKVGKFETDLSGDPISFGVYGGYNFDQNFGVEAEFQGSEDKKFAGGEYNVKTFGAYGTYRYHLASMPVYAKAKLGVANTTLEAKGEGFKYETDKTKAAGGLGLGFKATPNFGVEAMYNRLVSDVDQWGVSAHIAF